MKKPTAPKTPFPLLPSVLLVFLLVAACGCTAPRPLKGGKALTTVNPPGAVTQSLQQSDNPSHVSRQTQDTVRIRTYTLPTGTLIAQPTAAEPSNPCTLPRFVPQLSTLNSQPVIVTEREETRANTELGAAQKDTARELAAKLSSLKGIVWLGAGLFIFGLAGLFWPPLKAIIGSVTTSLALALGGVALIILPTLITGNEPLILGGVAMVVGAWFLAHRHGHARGMLAHRQVRAPR